MKHEDLKTYIGQLMNKIETEKEEKEIQIAILLLLAYMAGLRHKEFPLDKIFGDLKVEKEIPPVFHTLVAQLATYKSGINGIPHDYISKNVEKLLQEFRYYFIPDLEDLTPTSEVKK